MESPEAVAINRYLGLVLLDSDEVISVTGWFDDDGDETDDPGCAVSAIAQFSGGWMAIDLTAFENTEHH